MLRTFTDAASRPTDDALAARLAGAWPAMRSVMDMAGSFKRDWSFSNTSGWTLKVQDGKKALWYLIPRSGSFTVSMAIRESERDALLADPVAEGLRKQLESARRFSEGFALKFDVGDDDDLAAVEPFLRALIKLRK